MLFVSRFVELGSVIVIVVVDETAVNLYHTSNVVAAEAPPQSPEIEPSVVAEVAFCKFPVADDAGATAVHVPEGVSVTAFAQVLFAAWE